MYTLAENEKVVKSYSCVKSSKLGVMAETAVTVTNRRVIWSRKGEATGRTVDIYRDYDINGVTGFESSKTSSYNIMLGLVGLAILGYGFIALIMAISYAAKWENFIFMQFLLPIAGMIIGPILMYFGFRLRTNMALTMYLKQSRNQAFSIVGFVGFKGREIKSAKIEVLEGMEPMLTELPAVVLDVQRMGDEAIAKWQSKKSSNEKLFTLEKSSLEQI